MQAHKILAALIAFSALSGCLSTVGDTVSRAGDTPDLRFEAPPGMQRLMSPAPHNFRRGLVGAGDPVRRGRVSERYELREGDCGGSDCAQPRARAELQMRAEANPARIGEDIWYGWSFYNATVPAFRKENALRLVFGQWTMGGTNKPIFRFIQLGKGETSFAGCDPKVCNTRDPSKGDLVVQLEDIAAARGWGDAQNEGYVCRLFDLEDRRGQWTDIMVNTNFSTGDDGYLRIWVDQKMVCNYAGPLVSAQSAAAGTTPGHRRGIYSSWTKRWTKSQGDRRRPSLIVYYDEFRTGTRMSDVDVRQARAADLPPVD
ncbi:MAG: heparin lyase I family protein [Pseudomonadota bacterium]